MALIVSNVNKKKYNFGNNELFSCSTMSCIRRVWKPCSNSIYYINTIIYIDKKYSVLYINRINGRTQHEWYNSDGYA